MSRSRLIGFFGVLTLVLGLAAVQAPVALAAGTTWLVNNASASCSDSGPGTSAGAPFCTISKAATMATHAGDRVIVSPGTYAEQVTVPISATATAASPITFTASGPGVVVAGSSDYSDATGWAPAGTTAWSRSVAVVAAPSQVLSDGTPLTKAASLALLTTNQFFYDFVGKLLYVDAGGPNPAVGHTLVGTRAYGFKVWGTSPAVQIHDVVVNGIATLGQSIAGVSLQDSTGITVSGVTATQSTSYGILAQGSAAVTVTGSTAMNNGSVGIKFLNTTGSTISNSSSHDNGLHGISLQTSPNNVVAGNTSFRNTNPGVHVATGIDVSLTSTGVIVERNTTFGNSDSGIEIYTGSNNAIVRRNVSYDNGDHGLDCLSSPGESVVGNTVVGNTTAGINLEGPPLAGVGCAGSVVANNISSDNGMGASANTHGDIRLDKLSWQGSAVNRNLVFRTDGGFLYEWNASPTNLGQYSTVAAFNAATGQEANGIAADPRFTNLAARDLSLQISSPAVDSADLTVGGAMANDLNGRVPVDQPSVPNTGVGTPNFADRGALERWQLVATAPAAPTGVVAAAGNTQASVSWTPPVLDGGAPVTGYTVTASPGGRSATTIGATTATVTGLTNGTSYTFTVTATNSIGTSPASAASAVVTPTVLPAQTPDQRYVTRVYLDLFNRAPDAGGLAGWTAALASGTPRVAVANAITSSAEYRSKLITSSYAHYLGRTPDPGGLASWLAAMGRGMTIEQMQAGFIASPEYYAKAGSTPAGWVTKLYADVLGRTAAPSEVAGWTAALGRGISRGQVAMGFLLSTEHLTTVVDGYYQRLLGRGIDPSGQRTWVGILQRGGRDEAIIGGIIASAEYYARV